MLTVAILRRGATALIGLGQRFRLAAGGSTAIEYGLLAAILSVAIIGALRTTGTSLSGFLTSISGAISSAL